MVRALIVIALVSVLGVGAFFALPSSVFALPDTETDDTEVTQHEEFLQDSDSDSSDAPDIVPAPEIVPDASEVPLLTANGVLVSQPFDGTLSSTYVDLGRDCLWNLHWFDNYVYWRAGQYTYMFAYGDIVYSDGIFSSDSCTILTITAPTSYSGALTVSSSVESLHLSTAGRLLYSDLGDFPSLDSRKYIYDEVMYCAVVALGVHVLSSASSFILRDSADRGGAH